MLSMERELALHRRESQRFNWLGLVAGIAMYLAYAGGCFGFEYYSLGRFGIDSQDRLVDIPDRGERMREELRRSDALRERREWLPYRAYEVCVVLVAVAAMLITGVAGYREVGGAFYRLSLTSLFVGVVMLLPSLVAQGYLDPLK